MSYEIADAERAHRAVAVASSRSAPKARDPTLKCLNDGGHDVTLLAETKVNPAYGSAAEIGCTPDDERVGTVNSITVEWPGGTP